MQKYLVEILHIHKNAVWKSYILIKMQFDISKKSQKVARVYATVIDLYKSTGQIWSNFWLFSEKSCGQKNDNAVFYCRSTAHTGLFHKLSESVNWNSFLIPSVFNEFSIFEFWITEFHNFFYLLTLNIFTSFSNIDYLSEL